jgi:hypothetical protein
MINMQMEYCESAMDKKEMHGILKDFILNFAVKNQVHELCKGKNSVNIVAQCLKAGIVDIIRKHHFLGDRHRRFHCNGIGKHIYS